MKTRTQGSVIVTTGGGWGAADWEKTWFRESHGIAQSSIHKTTSHPLSKGMQKGGSQTQKKTIRRIGNDRVGFGKLHVLLFIVFVPSNVFIQDLWNTLDSHALAGSLPSEKDGLTFLGCQRPPFHPFNPANRGSESNGFCVISLIKRSVSSYLSPHLVSNDLIFSNKAEILGIAGVRKRSNSRDKRYTMGNS
eukprot:scaffold39624_cov191-Amphora_coffeaeformis.AAC.1